MELSQISLLLLSIFVLFYGSNIANGENINDSQTRSETNSNVENLKLLRKSVNFAYKCGNEFLNLIRGYKRPDVIFKGLIEAKASQPMKLNEIMKAFLPYVGYFILMLLGLIFVIFMPLVSICFCLCRCAGKCGGRIRGMDPKHAKCKRYTYALMLGIISVIMLLGLVLAFINNQLLHDSFTNPSTEINAVKQIRSGILTIKKSLKNMSMSLELAEKNKGDRSQQIDNANFKEDTANAFFNSVKAEVKKLDIEIKLNRVITSVDDLQEFLKSIKQYNYLKKLKLLNDKLKKNVRSLNFNSQKSEVKNLLSETLGTNYQDLKIEIKNQERKPTVGEILKTILDTFNRLINHDAIRKVERQNPLFPPQYMDLRMYINIGICCLLLLIVLFYFLGLCFGQCGERPFEDARICNRGVGANLMMAGVAFAFLFTPAIMLIEMCLFASGASIQTEICRYATGGVKDGPKIMSELLPKLFEADKVLYRFRKDFTSTVSIILLKPSSESLVKAINTKNSKNSPNVVEKIKSMTDLVNGIPQNKFKKIVDSFFKNIEQNLLEISGEIDAKRQKDDNYDMETKRQLQEKLRQVSKNINDFNLTQMKMTIVHYFKNPGSSSFETSLSNEIIEVLYQIDLKKYDSIKYEGLSNGTRTIVNAGCVVILYPFNGIWIGIGICMVFTIPAIIFAVKLAGLYRRTEKYSSDYEEPDYNSYMGFYTNNADNIPMKRPKSGKSSQKNRNSNSNKEAKQNNPQYLPVYPYDAYE